ncbi:MAG: hypothetical protein ALAOOOJD_00271 [bacterium]|nr:hypothetical protein [bacterium]
MAGDIDAVGVANIRCKNRRHQRVAVRIAGIAFAAIEHDALIALANHRQITRAIGAAIDAQAFTIRRDAIAVGKSRELGVAHIRVGVKFVDTAIFFANIHVTQLVVSHHAFRMEAVHAAAERPHEHDFDPARAVIQQTILI